MRTLERHEKLHTKSLKDFALLARLQIVHDSKAGDVLNHINCIRKPEKSDDDDAYTYYCQVKLNVLNNLRNEIKAQIYRGNTVLLG